MSLFLLLCVLIVREASGLLCDSVCRTVFDNHDGKFNSKDLVKAPQGIFTGVITVKGGLKNGKCRNGLDYLRFRKTKSMRDLRSKHDALIFAFSDGESLKDVSIYGEKNGNGKLEGTTFNDWGWKEEGSNAFHIQISDQTSDDFYNIYINKIHSEFKYSDDGSDNWGSWRSERLNTVNRVVADQFCTHYDYITICPDATPRLCDGEPIGALILGSTLTLTCEGAGSPILEVAWTKPDGTPYLGPTKMMLNKDEDVITSTMQIENYSIQDGGIYTCTVKNQNFGHNATKTFDITYKEDIKVTPPEVTTFTDRNSIKQFAWVVTGWPLTNFTLDCDAGIVVPSILDDIGRRMSFILYTRNSTTPLAITCQAHNGYQIFSNSIISYKENLKSVPPSITYYRPLASPMKTWETSFLWTISGWPLKDVKMQCASISFPGQFETRWIHPEEAYQELSPKKIFTLHITNQSIVTCDVVTVDGTIDTTAITRVGFNCSIGSYGDRENCLLCPEHMTSLPESDDVKDCYNVTSQCIAGDYGEAMKCLPCPKGTTSLDYTVKRGDCFEVPNWTFIISASGGGAGLSLLIIILIFISMRCRRQDEAKENSKRGMSSPPPISPASIQRPINIVSPLEKQNSSHYAMVGKNNVQMYATLADRQTHHPNPTYATILDNGQSGKRRDTADSMYTQVDKTRRSVPNKDGLYSSIKQIEERRVPEKQEDGYTKVDKKRNQKLKKEGSDKEGLYTEVIKPKKAEGTAYAVMDDRVFKGRRAEREASLKIKNASNGEKKVEGTLYSSIGALMVKQLG